MNKYHFIGIGGIGMSALARILLQRGAGVQGSDAADSYVLEGLKKMGALLSPAEVSACSVVYSSAISPHHPEYQEAVKQQLPLLHRSDLLAELMSGYQTLLVTGTHGKTTTSSLLAHVLHVAEMDPSFALGGIPLNLSSNGHHGTGRFFVAEADESDGTFLKYPAFGAIVTNLEEDHLDYWKTKEALLEGFRQFSQNVESHLWWFADDPALASLNLQGQSYGFSREADLRITKWRQEGWKLVFDLGDKFTDIEIPLIGKHNVANSAGVFGLSLELGIPEETIRKAFQSFQGIKRRMEKKGEKRGVCFYDDYAHHPSEIKTTLRGIRRAIGERRLIVLFQPHRYSRVRDCWNEFLNCFDDADLVFMTDIWSAGEQAIDGITTEKFYKAFQSKAPFCVNYVPRKQFSAAVSEVIRPHDVVISLGAGDITDVCLEILEKPVKPYQLALFQGGKSAEHEISLRSARVVLEVLSHEYYNVSTYTLSKEGEWFIEGTKKQLPEVVQQLMKCEVVVPILHGPFGEDGSLQGFFETLGLPYTGSDFRSCAISMDKAWTKHIAARHGIAIARFTEYSIHLWEQEPEKVKQEILQNYTFPFYLKAVHLGSTFGVFRIKEEKEISIALEQIRQLDYRFLVEEEIQGREMEFGFIGNFDVAVSLPAEVTRAGELHTYENKYSASGNPSIPNAPMPESVRQVGRNIARKVYDAAGCSGFARIDFFLKDDATWVLNEINPIPGITPTSVYPIIWKEENVPLSHVLDRIVIAGLHRKRYQDRHLRPPQRPPVNL